jgi:hypothetical protein
VKPVNQCLNQSHQQSNHFLSQPHLQLILSLHNEIRVEDFGEDFHNTSVGREAIQGPISWDGHSNWLRTHVEERTRMNTTFLFWFFYLIVATQFKALYSEFHTCVFISSNNQDSSIFLLILTICKTLNDSTKCDLALIEFVVKLLQCI